MAPTADPKHITQSSEAAAPQGPVEATPPSKPRHSHSPVEVTLANVKAAEVHDGAGESPRLRPTEAGDPSMLCLAEVLKLDAAQQDFPFCNRAG